MIYYNYEFKTKEYQERWRDLLTHTFENMELYYRKQLSMRSLLSHFRKAFKIAPITLKTSKKDEHYKDKLFALYLLTKYSNTSFKEIADEFFISVKTVESISSNEFYALTFQDDIRFYFKSFEMDYLEERRSSLAFQESVIQKMSIIEKNI